MSSLLPSELLEPPLDPLKRYCLSYHAFSQRNIDDLRTTKFIRIDREYVLAGAKAAQVPSLEQKVVYVSSGAASSSSFFPYVKSKGLTEEGLALLGYQETIIFRPGMLVIPGGRAEHRLVEKIAASVLSLVQIQNRLSD